MAARRVAFAVFAGVLVVGSASAKTAPSAATEPPTTSTATDQKPASDRVGTAFPLAAYVQLICTTEGIGVAAAPPTQSTGEIRLIVRTENAKTGSGRWWVHQAPDAAHTDTFAAFVHDQKSCPYGCPMVRDDAGQPQLWSPRVAALTDIAEGETLMIAVIANDGADSAGGDGDGGYDIKASTFEGPAPLIFEKGRCTRSEAPDRS